MFANKIPLVLSVVIGLLLFATSCGHDNIIFVDPVSETGTTVFESYIDDTQFTRTVSVIFSTSGSATVENTTADFTVTINGNDVTIAYSGDEKVKYALSGTTTDGFFKIYSAQMQAVELNSVSITNRNGAAINLQGPLSSPTDGEVTYIVVKGSNMLADGTLYTDTPTSEDEKASLFAEGQLILCGGGALTVTATGKAGITSDASVLVMSNPTLHVSSSAGHGMRGKDYLFISNGTLDVSVSAAMKNGLSSDNYVRIDGGSTTVTVTGSAAYDSETMDYSGTSGVKADVSFTMNGGKLAITNSGAGGKGINCDGKGYFYGGEVSITTTGSDYTTGDISAKGIKVDGDIAFAGSSVTVNCASSEGIESKGAITISDGIVYSCSYDDAINSSGDFTITGGYVYGRSTNNDALDANGNFHIQGGVIYAISARSPEVAIDANSEEGKKLYLQGGTVIAIGGLERGASLTQSCYSSSSWSPNTMYAMTVGSNTYAFKTPASGGTPLVVSGASTPTLLSGVSVSGGVSYFDGMLIQGGSVSGGSSVSLSSYTGGGQGPGGH